MSSSANTVGSAHSFLTEEDTDQFLYIEGSPASPLTPSDTDTDSELNVVYVNNEMFVLPKSYEIQAIVKRTESGNVICSALHKKTEKVAIHKKKPSNNLRQQKRMLRDLRVMLHLSSVPNPNILYLKDVIEPLTYQAFRDLYYVTDLMDSNLGDLLRSNRERNINLNEKQVASVLRQILLGLKHINEAGLIHRNVTPEAILVNSNNDNFEIKLCHFDTCRSKDIDTERLARDDRGAEYPFYRPPELLYPNHNDKGSYRSDIWSVGCIFAELLGSEPLFKGNSPQEQMELIVKLVGTPDKHDMKLMSKIGQEVAIHLKNMTPKKLEPILPSASAQAIDLLYKMLQFSKDRRISVNDALEHPFFSVLGKLKKYKNHPAPQPFDFSYEQELVDSNAVKKHCFKTIEEFSRLKKERKIQMNRTSKQTVILKNIRDRFRFKIPPASDKGKMPNKVTPIVTEEIVISNNNEDSSMSFGNHKLRRRILARNIENAWSKARPYVCCCCK